MTLSQRCKCVIFADDSCIVYVNKSLYVLHNTLEHDLGNIKEWKQCNKLKVNISKTNLVAFKDRSSHFVLPPVYLDFRE